MHPVEVANALETMKILVDTRERPTETAKRRYASFGVPWERKKLDFGDYSASVIIDGVEVSFDKTVAIERKENLDECCLCFTRERDRFEREFERARVSSARLYLLIEYGTWENAYAGKYRSQMQPNALTGSILAWMARYGSPVLMCKPETSGRLIRDIMFREMKERLMTLE